jgi:peptidoglycan/xylan/chitin deacetylase (PgdA/CDA1 family)
MRRYRKYVRAAFLTRLATVIAVVVGEMLAVHLYNINRNLIHNVSWDTITQSYLPSWGYELTHHVGRKADATSDATSVPVLVYHGLVTDADQSNMLIKDFRRQLFALKSAGWQTISMDDYAAFVQGKKQLPARSFLLTFDDGRKDSFYDADPILRALGYRATMFVIAHHALEEGNTSTYYLNESELQKMVANKRWDIEAHSFNGHDLVRVSKDGKKGNFYSNYSWLTDKQRLENQTEYQARVQRDISEAKQSLQNKLHIRVGAFAYPFGDYGQETLNNPSAVSFVPAQVHKQYAVAFSQEGTDNNTVQNYLGNGGYSSTRIEPSYYWTPDNLLKMLRVGTSKQLPYTDTFTDVQGWLNIEGSYKLNPSHYMELRADQSNTTAGVALDGTQSWKDYSYALDVDWLDCQQVSLLARYTDDQNYLACSFGSGFTSIRQVVNGKSTILSNTAIGTQNGKQSLMVDMRGDRITCGINGTPVLDDLVDNAAGHGMIGISIWDPAKGTAQANVTKAIIRAS